MKFKITWLIAVIISLAGFIASAQPSNGVNINGVLYVPWTATDTSNLDQTVANVQAATNGLSFTNVNVVIASGYANDSVNGQNSYFSADWRFLNTQPVGLSIGADIELNTAGNGLHQADLRLALVKDVNNFEVFGYPEFGRQFDGDVGYFIGLGAGVRYNLTAGLANSTNPILNFLGGAGKVDTFAETRFEIYAPFQNISLSGTTIDKVWRFGVGIAF